jgi:hypothetical protein
LNLIFKLITCSDGEGFGRVHENFARRSHK